MSLSAFSTWTQEHLSTYRSIEALDEAARERLNRQIRLSKVHASESDDFCACGCGQPLPADSTTDMLRACAKREWMRKARANLALGHGRQDPTRHPCEACGTVIQKWVNSNLHRFCPECREKPLAWRKAKAQSRAG